MNGVCSSASFRTVGSAMVSMTSSTKPAGSHGSGEYAPMPPVFGPASPSPRRL